jgi:hypothetical protein
MSTVINGSSPSITFSDGTTQSTAVNISSPYTANGVVYASSTSALATGSSLVWNGTSLGVGTSSPSQSLEVNGNIFVNTASGNPYLTVKTGGAGNNPALNLTASSNTWTVLGTFSNTNTPLLFQYNGTTLMDLDNSGRLGIGITPGSYADNGPLVLNGTGFSNALYININGTGSANQIKFANGNGVIGSVTTNGSATAFNTSSDYRLKNTIEPMIGALAKVQTLKPVTYKWNADNSDGEGFIAHELQQVCPQAVHGTKDEVDAEGNPVYQGIDVSFLVATLTAAIQELNTLVTTQSAEIAALKQKVGI